MNGIGFEFQPRVFEFPLQLPAPRVELARRRALKGEDRLLLVADREHGAHHAVTRARTGGEFRDEMRDDVPLPGAGILRLVDQHMIDAAVELVVHPGRRAAGQQGQCLVDQIVIVEQAAFQLFAPVVCGNRDRDMQQRFGAVARDDGAALFDQRAEPARLGVEAAADRRIVADESLRHH